MGRRRMGMVEGRLREKYLGDEHFWNGVWIDHRIPRPYSGAHVLANGAGGYQLKQRTGQSSHGACVLPT